MNRNAVVDGFKQFLQHAIDTQSFDVAELKNFMEPIFKRAGYRICRKQKKYNNILLLHEAAVGDFVTLSPAIREVRRNYPDAHITLSIDKCAKNLAELCPYVDELITGAFLENERKFMTTYISCLNIAQNLLLRQYDIALAFAFSLGPNVPLLAYMSGACERISFYGGVLEPLLTEILPPFLDKTHAVDAALRYVEHLIKQPIETRELEVWVDDSDIEVAKNLLPKAEKIYAIGLGGTFRKKHYSPECYAELINMLRRAEPELKFIVLGGSNESEEAAIVMSNVDADCIVDLTGKTTFRQTAAVLNFCNMYIGNDSVAMHLAAATATPVLSPSCFASDLHAFPNVREHWSPHGVPSVVVSPTHAIDECRDSKDFWGCKAKAPHCITQITPQNLFEAYKILLGRIAEGNTEPFVFNAE